MHLPSSNQPIGTQHAAKAAERLFGFYPRGAATDPEVFMTGVVQLLAAYPRAAVEAILSPLSGLPTKHKFLPSIAEIHEALEAQVAPLRRQQEREHRLRALPPPPSAPRPTLAELKTKYGENFGLSGNLKGKNPGRRNAFRPLSELIRDAGISEVEFEEQQKLAREFIAKDFFGKVAG